MHIEDFISIGANCLVEIEVKADNVEIEEFLLIRISLQESAVLIYVGVSVVKLQLVFKVG